MEKVLVIAGPTAVGKTKLGIDLAKIFDGEIISGDSMQVYRNLDIGTAKVTFEEMYDVPHHLIDIKDITENYSAFDFQKEARKKITEITKAGKLPIVVGGTGLYIQTLLYDFELGGVQVSQEAIERLEKENKELGTKVLWERLAQLDAKTARQIHPNNHRRIIRALAVIEAGGQINQIEQPKLLYDVKIIALTTEREKLYERINKRVDLMLEQGLLEEAEMVYQAGDVQGAKAIGYKEFFPYFQGEITLEEAISEVKKQSRRYAKRQLTWFRNRLPVEWYDVLLNPEAEKLLIQEIKEWLDEK